MKRYTQKEIRDLVSRGRAIDISNHKRKEINGLKQIGYAESTYGVECMLFQDARGQQYAITSRTQAIWHYS